MEDTLVLCGANAYEKKYYFNQEMFGALPESVQEELHIICVLFTEEVGGVFMIVFDEDGMPKLQTDADEDDLLYDEISAGLLVKEVLRRKQDLFESLALYYRVFILGEDIGDLLDE